MPTNYEPRATNYVTKTPESRVAYPIFMRPIRRSPKCNPMATNHLLLRAKKIEISGLMRPSCLSLSRLPHNPHPATYTPPRDADPSSLRHQLPFRTPNPLTTHNLSLCAKKHQISGLLRHRPIAGAFPTTYNLPPSPDVTLSLIRSRMSPERVESSRACVRCSGRTTGGRPRGLLGARLRGR